MSMSRFLAIAAVVCGLLWPFFAGAVEYSDPEGDDNGPGSYVYPTDRAYTRGSFDLKSVTVEVDGDEVEIRAEIGARIEDPWRSEEWDGNGFSLQFIQVYIDVTAGDTEGFTAGLPGMNVQFPADQAWNRVVLMSPQGGARLQQEVNDKGGELAAGVVIPATTRTQGRTIISRAPLSAIGGDPATWGIQVLVQSNEGFPTATDILTRPVNEFEGPHRFGGGSDYNCDPHVIDMLAGQGLGDTSEVEAQHGALSTFTCDESGLGTLATVPMVYR